MYIALPALALTLAVVFAGTALASRYASLRAYASPKRSDTRAASASAAACDRYGPRATTQYPGRRLA
jgi:hypothetical protein